MICWCGHMDEMHAMTNEGAACLACKEENRPDYKHAFGEETG